MGFLKTLLLSSCLLLLGLQAKAQFSFGAKGGVLASFVFVDNINIRQTEPNLSQNFLQGITFGGVARYIPKERNSGILMEFNFTQKGWQENVSSGGTYTARINYIEIPFMSHIRIGRKRTKIAINAGPSFTYMLSFEEQFEGGVIEDDVTIRITEQSRLRAGYGLAMGVSFMRATKAGDFQLDFRYNLGLSNTLDRIDDTVPDFSQMQDAGLSLTYIWPFGRKAKKAKPLPLPAEGE